jgi:iron complex outermembrane receptor protein
MTRNSYRLATFIGASLLSSTSAFAQQASSANAADTGANTDIIVTAQRREERLQDVPIAITAMTAKDLETRQVNSTLDIVNYVPNMIGHENTSVGTANAYALRGLANTESISTFDPPVGTYIDDIYLSRQNANNFSFFDIDRIEVLRGPQGTLFGRNTTGGAVNIVMRKPGDELAGYANAGYGSYNRKEFKGSIDLPVSQKLLTKLSAYYDQSDGYVHDLVTGQKLNGEKSWGVRGAVRALLSDTVTWDLTGSYTKSSLANFPNFYDPTRHERVSYTPFRTDQGLGTGLVSSDLADVTLGNRVKTYLISSNFQVEANDHLTVNFITGYLNMHQNYLTDSYAGLSSTASVIDGTDLVSAVRGFSTGLADRNWTKQFSQEVKATGKAFDGLLTYVGGFYYINEKNWTNFANITVPLTGRATRSADRIMTNSTEAYAGYFQGDLHPTSKLTLTAGIRYTDEDKKVGYEPNASPLAAASALYVPFDTTDVQNAGIATQLKSKVWTPRFAINYKIDRDIMLFASATKGFKSGGWNSRAYYASGATAFQRETIWSYEGGVRSEWFDHKFKANLTGFYYTDYNIQLPGGALNPTTGTITYLTTNVGNQRDYGLEAEFTLTPVRRLNLFWSMGTQRATYTHLNAQTLQQQANCLAGITANNCGIGIVTADGKFAKPNRAPHFSSTLGGNYTFLLGNDFSLEPSVNWNYISGTWVSTFGAPTGYQPGHSIVNAGLTLRSAQHGWSLSVECNNCFNDRYRASFLIFPYFNNPGTWMLRAGYKF